MGEENRKLIDLHRLEQEHKALHALDWRQTRIHDSVGARALQT
jgi:hypothetical protein